MNRRDMLMAAGTGLVTVAARSGNAHASPKQHHKGHTELPHAEFRKQAELCLGDGHACLQHCLELLGDGDTSVVDCATVVKQMVAICAAVGPVATTGSKHVTALAKLCHDICVDCKAECDKHASKHPVCKKCGDSCAKMIQLTASV